MFIVPGLSLPMKCKTPRQMIRVVLSVLLGCVVMSGVANAQQRISSFTSHITLYDDDSAIIREVIIVESEGQPITQGIYRDIKTIALVGPLRAEAEVYFEVLDARHNGDPMDYEAQYGKGIARLQFSPKDEAISRGTHIYELEYRLDRQVRFGEERSILKWNVNGYGWWLPADLVSLKITLPPDVPRSSIQRTGRTGIEFERENNFASSIDPDTGDIFYQAASLLNFEALVAEIEFDSGHIQPHGVEPEKTLWQKTQWSVIGAGGGIGALLVYWLAAWIVFGRYTKPRARRSLVATPPMGLSAPCLRYVFLGTYDQRSIASGFLSVATQHCLRVTLEGGAYVLQRMSHSEDALKPFEERLVNLLDYNALPLGRWDQMVVNDPTPRLNAALRRELARGLFKRHSSWLITGFLLSIMAVVGTVRIDGATPLNLLIPIAVAQSVILLFIAWRVFKRLCRIDGSAKRIADEARDFSASLSEDDYTIGKQGNAPAAPMGLYESYLPYAVALEVEERWTDRFKDGFVWWEMAHNGEAFSPDWLKNQPGGLAKAQPLIAAVPHHRDLTGAQMATA